MTGQLTWLVTGCSSGLGEAIVQAILAKGDKAIATTRASKGISGADRLSALKEAGAAVYELDMGSSEELLQQQAKDIWETYGPIDVLVNNAGYIEAAAFEEMNDKFLLDSLRINAFGPFNLTRAFLPMMRARRTGTVLFSGTVGSYYGAPGGTCYCGSKGLIEGVVPHLALEIAPFNLRTSILTYGHFRTPVMEPGHVHNRAPNPLPDYVEMNTQMVAGLEAWSLNQPGDPRKAADLVVEAVRAEGRCEGKELPLRLPVGLDTFDYVRKDCEEKMQILGEWEGVSSETNC
ncbi:short-chain oxidoreductase [Aspergillus sclerotioniger CBS 115572]|uniref:Short-chain oxidoreductase n=1 Tax=Aspergillus sclerotioniger CBS 115572 TaxID=1450535 RepID=A0A317WN15_9EURO|nr:short-chain oxidoreductase [Aspergillus sclerotioniger CBS 115572]PWY87111.1 short-chain oxidoreductase [Aspergillus sclerotioniger CBS 115572]